MREKVAAREQMQNASVLRNLHTGEEHRGMLIYTRLTLRPAAAERLSSEQNLRFSSDKFQNSDDNTPGKNREKWLLRQNHQRPACRRFDVCDTLKPAWHSL
jgi:hypothetical protein